MKKLLVGLFVGFSLIALGADAPGIYVGDSFLGGDRAEAADFIADVKKLASGEIDDIEGDGCIVYTFDKEEERMLPYESIAAANKSLEADNIELNLEGIYGEAGDHLFEIYLNGEYVGAVNGIYLCE